MTNRTRLLLPALFAAGIGIEAQAAEIPANTAQMQAMDKITGRVSVINVPVNAEVKFGSFSIVVRDCRTRPPEETPENFAFVDVADTLGENEQVNIFKGWMLSSTPALNAIEHPVYDVWLLKCLDTDISGVQTLTPDELAARDRLPMQRTVETTPKKAAAQNGGFEEINLSGEPIDLLPAAVREEGEESAAQTEVIPFKPEETDIIGGSEETLAEENAPRSLLNFSRQNGEDSRTNDITTNIEIRENGEESVIKSDARILSLPENGENTASEQAAAEMTAENTDENAKATPETAGEATDETAEQAAQQPKEAAAEMTTENKDESVAGVSDAPEEDAAAPKVSEDTLRELEEELSRKLADD